MGSNRILIGYMGCGKTSVGQILGSLLGLRFYDLDALIVEQQNQAIGKIFQQQGEAGFRKIEHRVLKGFVQSHAAYVLSVGGGTPCHYNHMVLMNAHAKTIYLQASVSVLFQRLRLEKSARPMLARLADDILFEFISKHLFEREAFYEKAHERIDVDNKSIQEIAEKVKEKYDLKSSQWSNEDKTYVG